MKRILFTSIVILLFLTISFPVAAAPTKKPKTTSDISSNIKFPTCPAPGGSQVAGYPEGLHWIVGESVLRWGSDFVYRIKDAKYVQCYCSLEAKPTGIQTNWFPASLVTEDVKQQLIANGWIYVANGADFGLENVPFLAQNKPSKCTPPKPSPTPRSSPTPKPTPSPICETVIDQTNKTVVEYEIGAGANTGKNVAGANVGGTTDIKTGNATTDTELKITGGNNEVKPNPDSSTSTKLNIIISGNGDGSTNSVGVN